MPAIKIYSKDYCPYCDAAKTLFQSKNVLFEEIDVTTDPNTLGDLVEQTGQLTVPQIFIDEEFIGGFDDLRALAESGELDAKLAA